MSIEEKEIIRNVMAAVSILPDAKREYILGYAEGVIAMAERERNAERSPQKGEIATSSQA